MPLLINGISSQATETVSTNSLSKSYYASVDTANGRNFVHTENMVLVDMEHHLRGIYHGTDSADVVRMVKEIRLLLQEERAEKMMNS